MIGLLLRKAVGMSQGVEEVDHLEQRFCDLSSLVGPGRNCWIGNYRKKSRWLAEFVGGGRIECLLQGYNLGEWKAFLVGVVVEGDQ